MSGPAPAATWTRTVFWRSGRHWKSIVTSGCFSSNGSKMYFSHISCWLSIILVQAMVIVLASPSFAITFIGNNIAVKDIVVKHTVVFNKFFMLRLPIIIFVFLSTSSRSLFLTFYVCIFLIPPAVLFSDRYIILCPTIN